MSSNMAKKYRFVDFQIFDIRLPTYASTELFELNGFFRDFWTKFIQSSRGLWKTNFWKIWSRINLQEQSR